MVALYFHVRQFLSRPVAPAVRQADPCPVEIVQGPSTVVYLALEEGDSAVQVARCLVAVLTRQERLRIPLIIHSFNHLSERPLKIAAARELYGRLASALEDGGVSRVAMTSFGWIYEITLSDIGQAGAKGRIVCRDEDKT